MLWSCSRRSVRLAHTKIHPAQWSVSDKITDRKSVFEGRAIRIDGANDVPRLLDSLKQDKKIAKATHNIVAWRLSEGNHYFDDDGEPPAGERILNLLQLTDTKNVLVVVTRWYGGVQLGGARFKHVGKCAHEALKRGQFL